MATRQHDQIIETPTEARQAELGPSVLAAAYGLYGACGADPGNYLVRVFPQLSFGEATASPRHRYLPHGG